MAKKIILALVLLFLISISSNTMAFSDEDVTVYESVYVKGVKEIPVSVYNYSAVDNDLKVDLIAPSTLEFEFIGLDEKVPANMKETFKIKLTPLSDSLAGKQYKTTLVVWLGNEMVRKEIFVNVMKQVVQKDTGETQTKAKELQTTPFVVLNPINIELVVNVVLAVIAIILAGMLILRIREK